MSKRKKIQSNRESPQEKYEFSKTECALCNRTLKPNHKCLICDDCLKIAKTEDTMLDKCANFCISLEDDLEKVNPSVFTKIAKFLNRNKDDIDELDTKKRKQGGYWNV